MLRKPSSYNYKRLSSRVRESTIETHVSAPRPSVGHRKGANQRYAKSAVRGEIHQVLPNTSTREGRLAYEARMNRKSFVERNVAAGRRRKIALVAALAVAIVVAACIAASFVFVGGIDSRLSIQDSFLKGALAADSGEGAATYTLLAADFDDGEDGASPDALIVLRTDADAKNAYAISLPAETRVTLANGSRAMLGEVRASSGDAGVISAVNDLLGIKVSHYATVSADGFVSLVDSFGGIVVDLPEDIADPDAGDITLSAGSQTLDGQAALFACRADDYALNAQQTRGRVQALVAAALMEKAQTLQGGIGFFAQMDSLADYVQIDMDVKSAGSFLDGVRGIAPENVQVATLPTYASEVGGKNYQIPMSDEVTKMMDRIRAGQTPQEDVADVLGSIDAGSYTVSVYNGGDVIGAASEAADMLRQAGFNVTDTGNTTMQVYDETLIVYAKDTSADAANAIVATLGIGRSLQDTVHYSFDTDIYVVVGKDWRDVLASRNETVDEDGYIVPADGSSSNASNDAGDGSSDSGDSTQTASWSSNSTSYSE